MHEPLTTIFTQSMCTTASFFTTSKSHRARVTTVASFAGRMEGEEMAWYHSSFVPHSHKVYSM